jgi:predicted RNA binding protein YcfA (HicA-like mRNA interferase family)
MVSDEATRKIIKELRDVDWVEIRRDGRHAIYRCPCGTHQFALPITHSRVSPGVVGKMRRLMTECEKGQTT